MIEQRSSRPVVGDTVHVPDVGACEVISTNDPSLINVKTADGTVFRVGVKALAAMLNNDPADALAAQERGQYE